MTMTHTSDHATGIRTGFSPITKTTSLQAILTEDGKLVLGDLRSKGGEEWTLTGKSVTNLTKDEKKVLDVTLLPGNDKLSSFDAVKKYFYCKIFYVEIFD